MAVQADIENNTLQVPDLGVTLRTLMACAARGYGETKKRQWKLLYKGAIIGSVKVKDDHLKGAKDANRNSRNRLGRSGEGAKGGMDSIQENLGNGEEPSGRTGEELAKVAEQQCEQRKQPCESDGQAGDAGVGARVDGRVQASQAERSRKA